MWPLLGSFAVIGFVGSLHCAGMCGPLVIAMPWNRIEKGTWHKAIIYHLSRSSTYAILGVIVGFVGQTIGLAKWQQYAAIVAGILSLLLFFVPMLSLRGKLVSKWSQTVTEMFSSVVRKKSWFMVPLLGMLNGLLPCGFLAMALLASLASASPVYGGMAMFVFGLTTLPTLLLTAQVGKTVLQLVKLNTFQLARYTALILGVLFLLRGLNLNIPYISPKVESSGVTCCHKPK